MSPYLTVNSLLQDFKKWKDSGKIEDMQHFHKQFNLYYWQTLSIYKNGTKTKQKN